MNIIIQLERLTQQLKPAAISREKWDWEGIAQREPGRFFEEEGEEEGKKGDPKAARDLLLIREDPRESVAQL